jgi:hypothetical protein
MKKILLALILFTSMQVFSQVDSSKLKNSLTMQTRDWLFLSPYLSRTPEFENVYDSMKVKMRLLVQPTLTSNVKVDSIKNSQLLALAVFVKNQPYRTISFPYTRINSAIKATGNYVSIRVDKIDADLTTEYNQYIQEQINFIRRDL